ncbi:MAG: hypothetical protein K2Y05_06485 [Hyphomicrobiaceae bacterium]|nr:hypothetical protein [Hyphomicrobiaceae bacterium]
MADVLALTFRLNQAFSAPPYVLSRGGAEIGMDWHRIPNLIPAAILGGYVVIAPLTGVPLGSILLGLSYAVIAFVATMVMGTPAGIAKLVASLAPWLGPAGTIIFLSVTMLSAGAYGFVTRKRGERGTVPYLPFALVWGVAFALTGAFGHGLRG